MNKSTEGFLLQRLLVVIGVTFFGFGMLLSILAAILSFISTNRFGNISGLAIQFGPALALSGASIALFFSFWVSVRIISLGIQFLVFFLFNQATGIMLLGGLLMGLVGYYWVGSAEIALWGLRFHVVGWVLMILRPSFHMRVMRNYPKD